MAKRAELCPVETTARIAGGRWKAAVLEQLFQGTKFDITTTDVYTCIVRMKMKTPSDRTLPVLPCACANLRRAARAVTRMYNQELRATGLELTQFTLLMALDTTGETTQGDLGKLLALDTTSLTRMLRLLTKRAWIGVKAGEDRRQRLLRLTASGRQKLQHSRLHWERAQRRLQTSLGEPSWSQMGGLLAETTRASVVV
ncbi:MAG TPA: MarR family transcriptional regulator [Candidatus Dormibacteraeota bacterium]|nr:MarR family transcriptional regulator [Candidatus Dormibacteraeota bacterium]